MIRLKVYSYSPGGRSEEGQEQKWGKEFMAGKHLLSHSAAEALPNGFIEKKIKLRISGGWGLCVN